MGAENEIIDPGALSPVMQRLAAGEDEVLAHLWRSRIELHNLDTYAGIPMSKFPEDLRTYELILWERCPQVVIEVGVRDGGSTLWLRDRLFAFQRYRTSPAPTVVAVDVELSHARAAFSALPPDALTGVELIEGDIGDEVVAERVRCHVPRDAEVLVIEDAEHDATTTLAALQALAPLVRFGGYCVVEDTCVDIGPLRVYDNWPRGCGKALREWLADDPWGRRFRRRPDLQRYGLTCHPGGVLQRQTDL